MTKKEITRYAGLAGVRAKPAMYIGPVNDDGLFTLLREAADNFADVAIRGENKYGHIIFDKEPNTYWVVDHGPGIPVAKKVFEDERGRKESLSQFYAATGLTHAGSNFDSDQVSRGSHGIGLKTISALSVVAQFWTYQKGAWWFVEYKKGKLSKDVTKKKPPKLPHGVKTKPGTIVRFQPDLSLFEKKSKIQTSDVKQWCEITSYLVSKLDIKFTNEKGKTITYKSKGINDYITKKLEENKLEPLGKTFVHHSVFFDVALSFANSENVDLYACTNGLKNAEGGRHVKAIIDAVSKSLKPYAGKKADYKPTDLIDGAVGIINAKLAAPAYSNQRKDQLIDARVYDLVYPEALKELTEFWKKNKSLAKKIIQRAIDLRKKTDDFLKDKKLLKNVTNQKKKLSAKLADVNPKTPRDKTELFLVEGDSAAGPAKRARDKVFQAVYPLKGKPLNVMEVTKDKVNSNEELTSLLAAIGIDSKSQTSRYGKIFIMADADVDGDHISVLLLTFLYKYTPSLIKEGRVFIVKSPIFLSRYKNKTYFGFTKDEIYEQTRTKNADITYLKGLGECSDSDLRYFAMDPETRSTFMVEWPGSNKELKDFEALMGKSSEYRKKLLNVD